MDREETIREPQLVLAVLTRRVLYYICKYLFFVQTITIINNGNQRSGIQKRSLGRTKNVNASMDANDKKKRKLTFVYNVKTCCCNKTQMAHKYFYRAMIRKAKNLTPMERYIELDNNYIHRLKQQTNG